MIKIVCTIVLALSTALVASAAPAEILAPIDTAVNAMFQAAGAPNRGATRVVPIVSEGGVTSGYAQVTGTPARVNGTRAVLKITTTSPNGWTIEALVPVISIGRADGTIHRAYGVAVDAIVNGR
ncbi:MAG TPA: hypothetical protein VIO32_12025 [Candidatus Baltobacteraceae bacterium]